MLSILGQIALSSPQAVETSTYRLIEQTGYSGGPAPQSFGSWTLNLPVIFKVSFASRPVRLILMK